MKNNIILLVMASAFMLLSSCARNPVTGKRQVVLMSESQEIAMGQEADPHVIAQFGLYEDSSLQRFIRQKGMQMAAISHRPNIEYHFRIIDSDVINAFAVPGGYVYFTRGIMAHFNNEAQFAGVLGHEIGHITARHSVEQQRNQLLGQLGLIAGIVVAPQLAQFAEAASQGLSLMFLKFGRDAERESDMLGVEYSSKIGYDASEMADFFTTLERQSAASGAGELPDFLSTHPNPGQRQQTVEQLATQWKQNNNVSNLAVNRNDYLQRINGLIYGEDPRGGYRENNYFYHPVLKFQFPTPQGWAYMNSPSQVQLASPDGKALFILTLAPGNNLNEAANAVVQNYQLTPVQSNQTTVNGMPAIAMVADQAQQQGQVIRTLNYLIQYNNSIYHLIGVSSINDFNSYQSTFLNIMQDFRQLTDASKINRQPERVRLKTVSSTMTLRNALKQNGVPDARLEEMALLNGMLLNNNVSSGTIIKIVTR